MLAKTPSPPYYAVIFTSLRTEDDNGYEEMAKVMFKLASQQDGYLGVDSAREELGITVSYWRDLKSIQSWRENTDHMMAKNKGKSEWYKSYQVRITKVEREYGGDKG